MKNIIENALIALLSGVASYKPSTKEILWEDEQCRSGYNCDRPWYYCFNF